MLRSNCNIEKLKGREFLKKKKKKKKIIFGHIWAKMTLKLRFSYFSKNLVISFPCKYSRVRDHVVTVIILLNALALLTPHLIKAPLYRAKIKLTPPSI